MAHIAVLMMLTQQALNNNRPSLSYQTWKPLLRKTVLQNRMPLYAISASQEGTWPWSTGNVVCSYLISLCMNEQDRSGLTPSLGDFHKSGIWNTGLLVEKIAIYFGNGYLSLCFLVNVLTLLLWCLPPGQPKSLQTSPFHTNESPCWALRRRGHVRLSELVTGWEGVAGGHPQDMTWGPESWTSHLGAPHPSSVLRIYVLLIIHTVEAVSRTQPWDVCVSH